jgi:hypothetical protein
MTTSLKRSLSSRDRHSAASHISAAVGEHPIDAEGAEHVGIEPGEAIENMVNFIIEAKLAGDVIDGFEEHAIAERPYARGITLPAKSAGL